MEVEGSEAWVEAGLWEVFAPPLRRAVEEVREEVGGAYIPEHAII